MELTAPQSAVKTRTKSGLDALLTAYNDYPSSTQSYSTSIESTVAGIGSLTGKAVKALGNLTLRGLDHFIITARFQAILTIFPHSNAQATEYEYIQKIYDMVLEISRPKLYNDNLRRTALALLLTQINYGQTRELEMALERWNGVELEIFLHVLVLHSEFSHTYSEIICDDHSEPHVRLKPQQVILFMGRIVQKHKYGCQAVIKSGFSRLFLSFESQFSSLDLAKIYLSVLYIAKRPEPQFHASAEEAFQLISRSLTKTSFILAIAMWSLGDLESLIEMRLARPVFHRGIKDNDMDSILAFLLALYGAWKANHKYSQKVLKAGYLDVLFSVEKQGFPAHHYERAFAISLNILSHDLPSYTREDREKATDILLYRIANHPGYHFNYPKDRSSSKAKKILLILIKRLRNILSLGKEQEYREVMAPLVSFIATNALSNYQMCKVVIGAGFFHILYLAKEENEDLAILIADILQKAKYSWSLKQKAAEFVACQFAKSHDNSWLHLMRTASLVLVSSSERNKRK